jgi:hypothetical protein
LKFQPQQQQQQQQRLAAGYIQAPGLQGRHMQSDAGLLGAKQRRVSSSDPGSAALLGALSAARSGLLQPNAGGLTVSCSISGAVAPTGDSRAAVVPAGAAVPDGTAAPGGTVGAGPRYGSGSGHVAVVEQQLPQVAVLRVAEAGGGGHGGL